MPFHVSNYLSVSYGSWYLSQLLFCIILAFYSQWMIDLQASKYGGKSGHSPVVIGSSDSEDSEAVGLEWLL